MAAHHQSGWAEGEFLPRSFLFSTDPLPQTPAGLQEVKLPQGVLFISPDYACSVGEAETAVVALIGYCFDLRRPDDNEAQLSRRLAELAHRSGLAAMLEDAEDLVGRFAAICRVGERWHVFNDACATRSVFYAEGRPIIASHAMILGELMGEHPRRDLFKHYWCSLPGNLTPVAGVRVMPANFALALESRQLRRFWPRLERRERPAAEVVDELEDVLARTAAATAARYRPALSLTAGLDSRLSLSVYRQVPELVAFTYDRGEHDRTDVEIAARICERLKIEHRRLLPVDRFQAEDMYRVFEAIPEGSFDKSVYPIYAAAFTPNQYIHVRSSCAGVGRAFWRKHPGMATTMEPASWIPVSLRRGDEDLPLKEAAADLMREEMGRFFSTLGYDLSTPRAPTMLGYDLWDLVLIEHRLSTWHGPGLLGADAVFDTAILFNSRPVLDLLLAPPLAERKKGTLWHTIIARRLPEIADIPTNPRPARTFGQLFAGAYRQAKRRSNLIRSIEQSVMRKRA